jgi:hypothetical protein
MDPQTQQLIIYGLIGVAVLLLILLIIQSSKANRTIAAEKKRLNEDLRHRTDALLRLSTMPFLWALRSELLRDNYTQVEQYIHQFVKERGVNEVAFIDRDGNVKLASNKKWEGKPYGEFFKEDIKGMEDMTMHDRGNGERLIVAPVTGVNEKLGTAIIVYSEKELAD